MLFATLKRKLGNPREKMIDIGQFQVSATPQISDLSVRLFFNLR